MADIVVYKNEFNTIPLRDFRAVEMDLLLAILAKMRDKGTKELTLSFYELRDLSKYTATAITSFTHDLEKTYDKLLALNVKLGDAKKWTKFVLFTKYEVDTEKETVTIQTNPDFEYLINEITSDFTRLELEEVTSLRSSYSKALYRQLKQYKSTGIALYTVEDIRERLCVPESYKMYNINQRVIDPAVEELQPYFRNLKCTRIKGTGKNKRKTMSLQFTFDNQSGVNHGKRTFRDSTTGEYYDKSIYDLSSEEVDKAFPEPLEPQLDGQEMLRLKDIYGQDI